MAITQTIESDFCGVEISKEDDRMSLFEVRIVAGGLVSESVVDVQERDEVD